MTSLGRRLKRQSVLRPRRHNTEWHREQVGERAKVAFSSKLHPASVWNVTRKIPGAWPAQNYGIALKKPNQPKILSHLSLGIRQMWFTENREGPFILIVSSDFYWSGKTCLSLSSSQKHCSSTLYTPWFLSPCASHLRWCCQWVTLQMPLSSVMGTARSKIWWVLGLGISSHASCNFNT